jgi:hypothetical protein
MQRQPAFVAPAVAASAPSAAAVAATNQQRRAMARTRGLRLLRQAG